MSYFRKSRSSLSGVQSQPPGARIYRGALEGVEMMPRRTHSLPPGAGGPPRWYSVMQGATLGADDTGPAELSEPTLTDPIALQREQLSTLKAMRDQERQRLHDEKVRGLMQLAATLSIPLAAFIWKKLLKKDTSSP